MPALPPGREAFTLPLALLTVAGAGGARILPGGAAHFEPPPIMALVLAAILLVLLARAGSNRSGPALRADANRARKCDRRCG